MRRKQESEIEAMYDDWQASGLSQAAYCQREGVTMNRFKNDMSRLRRRQRKGKESAGIFNMVAISGDGAGAKAEPYCELRFSGGHQVQFSGPESLIGLKQLIGALLQQ
jgi:hypothetical protein